MEKLKSLFTLIVDCVPPAYNWELDARFSTPFVQLDIDDSDPVKESMSRIFDNQWDNTTIGNATVLEKSLARSLFGIEKEQLLFTTVEDSTLIFCAWWPWGSNSKVSLRIGYYSEEKKFFSS